MGECHNDSHCVKRTLERILEAQRNIKNKKDDSCRTSCLRPLGMHPKNTIPFMLFCNCQPLKVEGVTTCFDEHSQKEKFVCFLTFVFKLIDIKGDCVVLELLKFKNHHTCVPNSHNHTCSPCCQFNCEDVDDLIATGVCVTFEISSFNGIHCLAPVCV